MIGCCCFAYNGDVDESLDEVDVGDDNNDEDVNEDDEFVAEFTFAFATLAGCAYLIRCG
jgi:hypothetical protein